MGASTYSSSGSAMKTCLISNEVIALMERVAPRPPEDRPGRVSLSVLALGLDLLLLLDHWPGFIVIRQPQPDLRHVG